MSAIAIEDPGEISEAKLTRRVLSVPEWCSLTGMARSTAFQLIAEDRFPVRTFRAGRRVYIPISEVEQLLGVEIAA